MYVELLSLMVAKIMSTLHSSKSPTISQLAVLCSEAVKNTLVCNLQRAERQTGCNLDIYTYHL